MKKHQQSRMAVVALIFAAIGWSTPAAASHQWGPYTVDILIDGVPQPVYSSRGESFVAGSYGSSYEIRVHNQSSSRIEAIVAVDGRDVISGQPVSPQRHRGYIIGPYGQTSVNGFRSSTSQVATFRFSSVPESYAWRTGTSWGIGTIRVWVFEEAPPPSWSAPPVMPYGAMDEGSPSGRGSAPSRSRSAEAPSAPQAMGTAYGEQRWSPVSYTTFVRRSSHPTAVMGIRYNSWEMLAAAGIVSSMPPVQPVTCSGCWPQPGPFAPPPPPYFSPVWYR